MNSILTAAAALATLAGPALGACPEDACQTATGACDSAPCPDACTSGTKAFTLTGTARGVGAHAAAIDCTTGQPCASRAQAVWVTDDARVQPGRNVRVMRMAGGCCPDGETVELTGVAPIAPLAALAPHVAIAPISVTAFDGPDATWVGAGSDEHRSIRYITSSGDQSIEIRIEGDEVEAEVNGERVPTSRIKRTPSEVIIVSKDGEVLMRCPIAVQAMGGEQEMQFRVGAGAWDDDNNVMFVPEAEEHPKVMIGINFGSDDGFVWDLVPYDPDEAFVISSVIEGLPAAKAGLRDNDLVVAIDGERPATPMLLRERLMGKEPGDKIEFRVLRKGDEKNIAIKLAPYSSQALGQQSITVTPRVEIRELKAQEEARRALEEALAALDQQRGGTEQQRREIEAARKQIEKMFQQNQERVERFAVRPDGREMFFTTPRADEHVNQLEERLEQLEARLDGIENKLDRILDRMDR